jgi:hypothetical protein
MEFERILRDLNQMLIDFKISLLAFLSKFIFALLVFFIVHFIISVLIFLQ